jgi:hypothetical protein
MKRNQESHRSLFLQYDLPTSLLLLKQRRLIRAYSVSRSMRPALVEDALDAPAEKGPIEAITHPLRSFGWKLRILRLSLYNIGSMLASMRLRRFCARQNLMRSSVA